MFYNKSLILVPCSVFNCLTPFIYLKSESKAHVKYLGFPHPAPFTVTVKEQNYQLYKQ